MSGAAATKPKFVVAACQIMCGEDKAENIKTAEHAVEDAAAQGAQVWCACVLVSWPCF